MAEDPLQSDVSKATLLILAALLVIAWFVTIAVIVPGLVNLHNDGALILAVIVAIGATAFAIIMGRQLWRTLNNGENA